MAGFTGSQEEAGEFWASMLTTNASAATRAPVARALTPAPTVAPSLAPPTTPGPPAEGPVYFETTSLEISPVFAGMTASTAAMALLVLGCCCWGGRTKVR